MPRQTTGLAPRQFCHSQAGLFFRSAGFFIFSFSGGATKWSQNHFPTRRGCFCTLGTGSTYTASIDSVPIPSTGTAQEVGPLTSSPSSRGQSLGVAPWRAGYTPGDRLISWVNSTTFVQYLYISSYLSDNKPVLSYLLLRLLPQDHFISIGS
jgi:hypothetical protein